jgi:hypothetical protein
LRPRTKAAYDPGGSALEGVTVHVVAEHALGATETAKIRDPEGSSTARS